MAGHAGLGKDFFEISSEMIGGMGYLYYLCGVNNKERNKYEYNNDR